MRELINTIKGQKQTEETLNDLFSLMLQLDNLDEQKSLNLWIRTHAMNIFTPEAYDIVHKTYLWGGRNNFDDFMIAMEWKRTDKAKFWLPRRAVLEEKHHIATQIQEFIDDPNALYLGFSQPPGTGKALSDDTPVMTKDGWKNHGDLRVGDYVVGLDGEYKKVTHVFPKVKLDRRVWFTDGTYIDCHENHEWLVKDDTNSREKVLETKHLERRKLVFGEPGKRKCYYNFRLPLRPVMQGEERDLIVDPYTLGAWLGDGTNTKPVLSCPSKDRIIAETIIEHGYSTTRWNVHKTTGVEYPAFDKLRKQLQQYGMCYSHRTTTKHIPEIYFGASVEQRLELLAGLLDTDGYLNRKVGRYEFSTSEPALRDGFIQLVTTFGWRVSSTKYEPEKYKGSFDSSKPYWRISFNPTIEIPCRVPRKQLTQFKKQLRLGITKIEHIEPRLGNCIEVEGGMYLVGKNMHPTHNSTLIKFLMAYIAGRESQTANMYCSYGEGMVKMMFDSLNSMITDTDEYGFHEIFPEVGMPDISSEYKTISYRKRGDFSTLSFTSLGGSVTGRTRATRLLIADDLVKNQEEARSPERLAKLFEDYQATLTTRMIGDNTKILQLGTIWSIHDPISRMKELHKDDPKYKFIAIPAWDENHHSNFNYDHPDRYTDEKLAEIESTLDPIQWSCLFMQQGMEKFGLAFPSNELKYYNGVLPDGEPDNIVFATDIAWGGGDSLSMPIAYVYGDDVYIHDVIFDRGDKFHTKPRVVGKILQHLCKKGRMEANNGGDEYCDDIGKMLKENDYSMNLTSKKSPTNVGKMARIEQHAPNIKNFYYIDKQNRSKEYDDFMQELCSFSYTTKNLHDDAADSMAMLVDFLYGGVKMVKAVKRPF